MDQMSLTMQTVGAGFLGLLAYGAVHIVGDVFGPEDVRMTVKHLKFEDGDFDQWLLVEGGPIQADWAAKITRYSPDGTERFLCVGGGRSVYDGTPSPRMDPDFWTGADCPELQAGDHAQASWEYRDQDGTIHRVSAEIVLTIPTP